MTTKSERQAASRAGNARLQERVEQEAEERRRHHDELISSTYEHMSEEQIKDTLRYLLENMK